MQKITWNKGRLRTEVFKKVNKEVNSLSKVTPCMSLAKMRLLIYKY